MHFFRGRKFAAALLCALLIAFTTVASAVEPTDYNRSTPDVLDPGHLYGTNCILINADTGDVLFEKKVDERRYPASTTKIMTCILALESDLVGRDITIPAGIEIPSGSSKMGISAGETMLFDDLLYGMMIASGNDASIAVAMLVSGSESAFVRAMNEKAQELGMTGTHYENSHGYQRANHYTTARDLATLTAYAMKNREFREIVACKEHTIVSSLYPDGKVYTSKYDLLFEGKQLYYAPCIGVKTGYTNSAGRCFVGAAEQNGVTLVSVSLNTSKDDTTYSQVFTDTIRLCNYGFAQYREVSFREMFAMCDDSQLAFLVSKAAKDDANKGYLKMNVADIPDDYRESYLKKDWEDVNFQKELANSLAERLEFEFTAPLVAPISEGDILGVARYTTQSGAVLEGKIVASRSVAMEPPTMDELLDEWVDENAPWMAKLMPRRNPSARVLYLLLLAGIVTLIVLRVRRNRRRDRERRVMLEKKRREYLRRQKYLREHPEARRTSRPSASGTPARTPARKTSAGTSAKGATARPAARKPSAQAGRGTARPSSGTGAKRTQPPRGKDGFGRR